MIIKKVLPIGLTAITMLSINTATSLAAHETIVIQGPAQEGSNVTTSFSNTMRSNAAYMAYFAMSEQQQGTYPVVTGEEFAMKVKSGGPWDYKLQYGATTSYVYNNKNLKGEDLGNMHYGYVGRAADFTHTMLRTAAGAYQIYSGTSSIKWYNSYFDDPNDQAWIDYGISLWDSSSLPSQILNVEVERSALFNLLSDQEKQQIREKVKYKSDQIKAKNKK